MIIKARDAGWHVCDIIQWDKMESKTWCYTDNFFNAFENIWIFNACPETYSIDKFSLLLVICCSLARNCRIMKHRIENQNKITFCLFDCPPSS